MNYSKILIIFSLITIFNFNLFAQSQWVSPISQQMQNDKKNDQLNRALTERINLAGGDMAAIYKVCPRPRAWIPKEVTLDKASEWYIVPPYVQSKTFPDKNGAHTYFKVLKQDGVKVEQNCDYLTVAFQNTSLKYVDHKNCIKQQVEFRSKSLYESPAFRECKRLLGF